MENDEHKHCTSGKLAAGQSAGTKKNLDGKDVYVSEPLHGQFNGKAILFIHDAYGIDFLNNQLLADEYAHEANVRVYLPDFFQGDCAPLSSLEGVPFDFASWLGRVSREKKWPEIESFAKYLLEKEGVTSLAAAGFCWGAWPVAKLAATDLIKGGVLHHPTLLQVPQDIEKFTKPTLFLCAEDDNIFTPEKKKLAEETAKKSSVESTFVEFPGTKHGFAIRSDTAEAKVAALAAKNKAVDFFKSHL